MKKIPTVFRRDPDDMKHVLDEVTPGCEWVLEGEATATRKYDGTCVMFDGEQWYARREVKANKEPPPEFVAADNDPATGKTVGWIPIAASSFAKWHAEAVAYEHGVDYPVGTYELCGPKINGNPEGFEWHALVLHAEAETIRFDGTIDGEDGIYRLIRYCNQEGFEGIVWHHPDGRMSKLKVRDFA
jgi:hypothetical protein